MISLDSGYRDLTLDRFFEVGRRAYADIPGAVPESRQVVAHDLSLTDPYLQRGEREIFVVSEDGKPLCRAVTFTDPNTSRALGQRAGTFALFESVDHRAGFARLCQAMAEWFRSRDCRSVLGPMSPKITDPRGILVEGDNVQTWRMSGAPQYYQDLFASAGLKKAMDLIEYDVELRPPYQRLDRICKRARARMPGLTLRGLHVGNLRGDLETIVSVYNRAWTKNWGFIPISTDELHHSAMPLVPMLRPEHAVLAEIEGQCVGFQMILPDMDEVARRAMKGVSIEQAIATNRHFRAFFIGVLPDFRKRGVEALMISQFVHQDAATLGATHLHIGWMLETNFLVRAEMMALAGAGLRDTKRHRIYKGEIDNLARLAG